jgi:hypothetical protein
LGGVENIARDHFKARRALRNLVWGPDEGCEFIAVLQTEPQQMLANAAGRSQNE